MHKEPLVSVLIPNYNKASFLRETLDSVLQQTYSNWECIIVDDHSTDRSWEILEEYSQEDSRFKIFRRPEGRRFGGNAARNYAFELSNGDYINWLDSDDIINDTFLSEKILSFQKDQGLDYVLSDIFKFSKSVDNSYSIYDHNGDKMFFLNFGATNNIFQTPMPLYTRKFLNSFDYLFDEELIAVQDLEFHVRVLLKSLNYVVNPKSKIYWRLNEGSKTNSFMRDSYDQKYRKSYPAFKRIYLNIHRQIGIDEKARLFFKNVFNDMLLILPLKSPLFWELYFFTIEHKLFKGQFQGVKIFGIRTLKYIKLI
ncbi:Glycosyltransferase involved in cell wall bisynthesis [Cyclobacterium lianum]|uniref:Glycosyltransferase involved in cell wall bisynthesis n=1 Tax=Cyclobacterium lianum TaxID=388280 RepID=A0A1M7QKK4_9BACT|nr:glycosyltransferase family 2 protein [Cyclobacterium lianum]SHN31809.1 Glycosyltransferase involved in cell wall bisynthesis [Cyclobacterium lianum]